MPIRYRDLVGFHVPKTGGSTAKQAVMASGGHRFGGGHDPWSLWRDQCAGLRTFGTIREPLSRYASLYHHCLRSIKSGSLAQWGGGDPSFEAVLYGWTHPRIELVPRETAVIYHPGSADRLVASGVGLYSWEVRRIYGGAMRYLVPTDRIAEGLARLGIPGEVRHINPSDPYDVRAMYTDEMVDWVLEADRELWAWSGWRPWEGSPVELFTSGG